MRADEAESGLRVRPRLCVVEADAMRCESRVQLQWQSAQPQSLCLHMTGRVEPLECWREALEGRAATRVNTRDSVIFVLRDDSGRELHRAVLEVVQAAPRERRARRNPWSFF